ncbi:CHASE2 domain-containing protein [Arcobacter sp. YIC-464]|uniref:CHASE2 domain-containing protein n=1 Tax=Arcobacter sp. YIC-464 TaxID=3376631 RepID=UPI003C1614F2
MKLKTTILLIVITFLWHFNILNSSFLEKNDHLFFDYSKQILSFFNKNEIENNTTVIIDIDEKSLNAIGQWPWPRLINSKLIDNLSEAKPATILVDVIFPERDKTSPNNIESFYKNFLNVDVEVKGLPNWLKDNDKIFAQSLKESRVILPIYLNNDKTINKSCQNLNPSYKIKFENNKNFYTANSILCNNQILQENSKSIGFINASSDKDGVFRRVPLSIKFEDKYFTTLSMAAILSTEVYGKDITIKESLFGTKIEFDKKEFFTDKHTNVLLDFYGLNQYKKISAIDILTKNFDAKELNGKFVVIGTSAVGLHDYYLINTGENIPGVYAHATLIENFFNNDIISTLDFFKNFNVLVSLVCVLLLIYLMYTQRHLFAAFYTSLITASYLLLSIITLSSNNYIFIGYFFINFIFMFIVISFAFMIISYIEKNKFFEELSKSHQATLESMATVAEKRDTDTGGHIIRTKTYIKLLAIELAKKDKHKAKITPSYIESLYHAAPLHDLGKVGIADSILKKPGKLTPQEYEQMKKHSKFGYDILHNAQSNYKNNELFNVAKNIAYYHHEKWDGSGYPKGLKEEEIPLEARLMAVADVYDALINKRVYKPSFTYEDAENILQEGRGKHFDPEIIDTFFEIKEEFKKIAEEIKH